MLLEGLIGWSGVEKILLISVIVRSGGDRSRRAAFKRAVTSILTQAGVDVECIVVFNGREPDPPMLAWAREQPKTRCIVLKDGNKAQATLVGRSEVRGAYFCFLDDDDEFRPGSLAASAKFLEADPHLDCIASNGIYVTPDGARCVFQNGRELTATDYAGSVLKARNWLASCGGMFRSSTVGTKYFEDLPRHREWTVIAFRIASALNVRFVNKLSYRVVSSSASQSKRDSYIDAATESLQAMLPWTTNPAHIRAIRRRMADANHYISSYYRIKGDFPRAWEAYRSSIKTWNGLKYVPYGLLLAARQTRPARSVFHPVAAAIAKWYRALAEYVSKRRSAARLRRAALSGLPLFCGRLARQLEQHEIQWTAQPLKAGTHLDVLRAFFTILNSDLWYSIGEPRNDRRIEFVARLLGRPRVVHWVGSDVAALQDPLNRKTLADPRYTHLVEADWIADELRAAGLNAQIVPLPPTGTPASVPPMPERFTVLLYVPRTRADFYGLHDFERVIGALSHLPIDYLVVGGGSIAAPPGVRITNLGWVEDLSGVYRRSSLLVRFTRHDGLSLMVLEALAAGRHVLWTQRFPFCRTVRTAAEMEREIAGYFRMHAAGKLHAQTDAAQMVRSQYSEASCVQKLASAWEGCVQKPADRAASTAPSAPYLTSDAPGPGTT